METNICDRFIDWLRPEGIKFFKDLMEKYKTVAAVYTEYGIPHCVHFREGMQIRNWMRIQPEFEDKLNDDHWFDNNWIEFTEKCLKKLS